MLYFKFKVEFNSEIVSYHHELYASKAINKAKRYTYKRNRQNICIYVTYKMRRSIIDISTFVLHNLYKIYKN